MEYNEQWAEKYASSHSFELSISPLWFVDGEIPIVQTYASDVSHDESSVEDNMIMCSSYSIFVPFLLKKEKSSKTSIFFCQFRVSNLC